MFNSNSWECTDSGRQWWNPLAFANHHWYPVAPVFFPLPDTQWEALSLIFIAPCTLLCSLGQAQPQHPAWRLNPPHNLPLENLSCSCETAGDFGSTTGSRGRSHLLQRFPSQIRLWGLGLWRRAVYLVFPYNRKIEWSGHWQWINKAKDSCQLEIIGEKSANPWIILFIPEINW